MARRPLSLRRLGTLWMVLAFLAGLLGAGMWMGSVAAWGAYLTRAQVAGVALYDSLTRGTMAPLGVRVTPVPDAGQAAVTQGDFAILSGLPTPAYVTHASVRDSLDETFGGQRIKLAIVSDGLRYEVARVENGSARTAPEKLGAVTRLLATYCSRPILFAQVGEQPWLRIDGRAVWGCDAKPRDLRLPALLIMLLTLGGLWTKIGASTGHFTAFAEALKARRRLGGPESYRVEGPAELHAIVGAVNAYLEAERAQLARRASVLSGVSHDLGTPATRLRLRTALIEDDHLREKFDHDIDRMTGMIEGVLTYTRSELSDETPRQISLSSLLEAIVADYQDTGRPVAFPAGPPVVAGSAASLFAARRGSVQLPDTSPVLVMARPLALQRAIENLIDNALKYGRRASVALEASSQSASILIEDAGSDHRAADIEALREPFRRGANVGQVQGFGLGLTIVTAVAEQHGGRLSFSDGRSGICARLEISRQ
ncbi:HAMP domain-containing histidine kinase [Pseudooceanicola sp. CBS1P-1]|uniref:histidine kinase n=1 Tax=Pseudooceanicola albus TaxID=2692189 RepID=A0A6L7GAK3_9RHOB|nr:MULTISPECIES: HAMP domain-containing sensor histidine kinase [Pseudooceanicola]MBT9386535.1 HAMP domain-containing histidine kinase [Pseudooceanicola endophyticus]MXN20568.1 sensor histidine kinase [Pseudooceanicola albus]